MALPQVNLGESAIKALLKNNAAKAHFPFLNNPPTSRRAKRCCGGSTTVSYVTDYEWIKRQIVGLSPEGRTKLRQFLNARRVVISYRNGRDVKTETI